MLVSIKICIKIYLLMPSTNVWALQGATLLCSPAVLPLPPPWALFMSSSTQAFNIKHKRYFGQQQEQEQQRARMQEAREVEDLARSQGSTLFNPAQVGISFGSTQSALSIRSFTSFCSGSKRGQPDHQVKGGFCPTETNSA